MAEQNEDNPVNSVQATPPANDPTPRQAVPKAIEESDPKVEERKRVDRNRQTVREEAVKTLGSIQQKISGLHQELQSPDLSDEQLFKIADSIKAQMDLFVNLG